MRRALFLVALAACSKKEPPPDPQAGCTDACATALSRVEALDDQVLAACVDACDHEGLEKTCLYTARTVDDVVRCIRKAEANPLDSDAGSR